MKKKEFIDLIYSKKEKVYDGDHILEGMKVIEKYFPKQSILRSCREFEVCSLRVKDICSAGITVEDVCVLRDTDWDVNEYEVLCHKL